MRARRQVSLSICDFYVSPDGDHASETWEPLLLLLQEDHSLPIYGGLGDGAKAYPGTIQEIVEEAKRFSEDVFHTLLDLGTLRRKLENSAYRAFRAEYQAARQVEKEDTPENQAKLRQAREESLRQAELHDAFEAYTGWVACLPSHRQADAFQMVDLRSGEVRDREINAWLMDAAIEEMAQLDHPDVVKMSERLARHQKYLLNYLDWLAEHLTPLLAELHRYLGDPDLEKAVLQAVARTWRLEHEVEGMQRHAFRSAWRRAQQELAIWVAGDDVLERWSRQVHALLEWVQRTSSAAENINSILKPFLARKKHFGSAESLSHFVALFVQVSVGDTIICGSSKKGSGRDTVPLSSWVSTWARRTGEPCSVTRPFTKPTTGLSALAPLSTRASPRRSPLRSAWKMAILL